MALAGPHTPNQLTAVCVCVRVSLGALCLIFTNAAPPAVFVRV